MKCLHPIVKTLLVTAVTFSLFQFPAEAKKMYKWVDEDGRVRFSDKIPPSQVKHKRERIDSNADVVEIVPKAKTKEQIEMDKRLQRLRKQQEKLIKAQKSHDKVLLSTFRSLKDMKASHAKKLAAFDAQRKVSENALERQKEYLAKQKEKAATYEINNQDIPKELLDNIDSAEKQIENIKQEIQKQVDIYNKTKKTFDADVARFAFLTQEETGSKQTERPKTATEQAVEQLGLFSCEDKAQCNEAWQAARQFVIEHSNTKISIDTSQLVMTEAPISATDLSLSVSKMTGSENELQIFLDIRCKETMEGEELCSSAKAESIRANFNKFIKAKLGMESSSDDNVDPSLLPPDDDESE